MNKIWRTFKRFAAIWSALLFAQASFAACVDGASTHRLKAVNSDFVVGFTPSVWPIPVGKLFSVDFEVCSAIAINSIKIDADMPAHKHGMNYKPKISQTSNGYVAEGMMFHMPGKWRVTFELVPKDGASNAVRLTQEISID
jgi:hypothetical protein